MTAVARFKKVDITRAIAGATAAGMSIGRVEIDPNGKIVILSAAESPPQGRVNPLDRILRNR